MALLAGPASHSAAAESASPADLQRYEKCLTDAWRDPEAAFESAIAWSGLGGGDFAERCAATALFSMRKYQAAALRWQRAAETSRSPDQLARAEIYAQASQAWVMAEQPELALRTIDAAVALAPHIVAFRVDRGVVHGLLDRLDAALADFNFVLSRVPGQVDSLIFRATALRKSGRLGLARKDLAEALRLVPDRPDALLERGNLAYATGDVEAALKDWVRVVQLEPDTPLADSAQSKIEAAELARRRR